ncbi:MAG: response regulator [Acidobacteria bacterium]|nr:response regulator [Acidobacteriota bacterium]MBI3424984.1 response regulator [Acidobacteriota bacterium]
MPQGILPKRILIVDDEEDARLMISAVATAAGYETVEAADGREALDIMQQDADFVLVICDKMMPRLDGYEVIRFMRGDDRLKDIPVIMSTADRTTQHLGGLAPDGKTHFVNKASGVENMRQGIQRALGLDLADKSTREMPTLE